MPADAPPLPRKARRFADRLTFVERIVPSTEHAEDLDTARLVTRFHAGDAEAFTVLYVRYFDRVYRYLRLALADPHEAEDATQQVFIRVFESLPAYEYSGKPFRVWLFVVARNLARTQLRKLSRADLAEPATLAEAIESNQVEDEPTPLALDWISDRDLMLFVERLPDAQRQALTLRYLLDLSNLQIAEVLGRSPNDVAVLQKRALAFLRERLTAIGRGPTSRRDRARMRAWNPQAPVLRNRRFSLFD